jgi:hypothetical protein
VDAKLAQASFQLVSIPLDDSSAFRVFHRLAHDHKQRKPRPKDHDGRLVDANDARDEEQKMKAYRTHEILAAAAGPVAEDLWPFIHWGEDDRALINTIRSDDKPARKAAVERFVTRYKHTWGDYLYWNIMSLAELWCLIICEHIDHDISKDLEYKYVIGAENKKSHWLVHRKVTIGDRFCSHYSMLAIAGAPDKWVYPDTTAISWGKGDKSSLLVAPHDRQDVDPTPPGDQRPTARGEAAPVPAAAAMADQHQIPASSSSSSSSTSNAAVLGMRSFFAACI